MAFNYKDKILDQKISLTKFYVARVARIYPLHFATLLVSIPLFYSGLGILLLNIFLLQSYIPINNIFFSYNAPSWSISTEFFFYALFPLIIYIGAKVNYLMKILGVVIFIAIALLLNISLRDEKVHYWAYISPCIRIFDFVIGIILFDLYAFFKGENFKFSKNITNTLEITAILTLVIFFIFKNYLPINFRFSIYYWVPMCFIIFSFAFSFMYTKNLNIISNFLSHKTLVYLGEISFAFYLIHYLVIYLLTKVNRNLENPFSPLILIIAMFAITLLSSIFAFEKIEKPFNRKIKALFND